MFQPAHEHHVEHSSVVSYRHTYDHTFRFALDFDAAFFSESDSPPSLCIMFDNSLSRSATLRVTVSKAL